MVQSTQQGANLGEIAFSLARRSRISSDQLDQAQRRVDGNPFFTRTRRMYLSLIYQINLPIGFGMSAFGQSCTCPSAANSGLSVMKRFSRVSSTGECENFELQVGHLKIQLAIAGTPSLVCNLTFHPGRSHTVKTLRG